MRKKGWEAREREGREGESADVRMTGTAERGWSQARRMEVEVEMEGC